MYLQIGTSNAGESFWFWRVPFPNKWPRAIGWKTSVNFARAMGNPAVQWLSNMTSTTNMVDPTMVKRSSVDVEQLCKKPWVLSQLSKKGILCFPYTYSWHEILQQTFNMKQSCECSFEQDLIFICSFSAKIHDSNTTLSPLPVPSLHGSMGATRSYGISRKITKDSEGVAALEEISACNPLPGGVVYGCLWDLGRLGRFFGVEGFWDGKRGDGRGGRNIYSDLKYHPGPGGFEVFLSKISLRKIQPENLLEKEDTVRIWSINPAFLGFMWAMWLDSWWKPQGFILVELFWLNHIPDDPCMEHLPIHLA